MKRNLILFVVALTAAVTLTAAVLQHQQSALADKLIRLHVVANSDTEEDQALKLQVRDAVISAAQGIEDKKELIDAMPQIQRAAENCLRQNGSCDPVTVTLKKEVFPTRYYDTFSLPSGVYTALRVTIGEGQGHNWWCVAFPSLCFRATVEELEEAAVSAGFSETEVGLITEENSGYVLKFKALELLQELKNRWF